jgi:hypothetical protein
MRRIESSSSYEEALRFASPENEEETTSESKYGRN